MDRTQTTPLHLVQCPYCAKTFDLFAAAWCGHTTEPSKLCCHCGQCLCQHPTYRERHYWKEAPLGFRRQGFRRLFLLYI
jgi:predicted amidophosphoribosyltransferase